MKRIESFCFFCCYGLKNVILPAHLEYLGSRCFGGCSIDRIICYAQKAPEAVEPFYKCHVGYITVYPEAMDSYKSADYWKSMQLQSWLEEKEYNNDINAANIMGDFSYRCTLSTSADIDVFKVTIKDGESVKFQIKSFYELNPGFKAALISTKNGVLNVLNLLSVDNKTQEIKLKRGDDYYLQIYWEKEYNFSFDYNNEFVVDVYVNGKLLSSPKEENMVDNIIEMHRESINVKSLGSSLFITGVCGGEKISLYSIDGMLLDSVSAKGHEVLLGNNLRGGVVYILKIGNKSIKYKF